MYSCVFMKLCNNIVGQFLNEKFGKGMSDRKEKGRDEKYANKFY